MHRRFRRVLGAACALVVSTALMAVLGAGWGALPALGPALAPGQGVWSPADAAAVTDETPHLPGMRQPARVSFDTNGYVSITAATDDDLFLAQGYVAARLRLSQLDLARRLGSGQLAELNGPAQLPSDEFELRLGLLRTARAQWAATPPDSPAGRALLDYARGVNDRLAELATDDRWPEIYQLTGTRPAPWTPVDSLVVQGVLTQQLTFSTVPLDYAVLRETLGPERTAAWFPVRPVTRTAQQPYDPGPYRALPPEPFTVPNANAAPVRSEAPPPQPTPPGPPAPPLTRQTASTMLTTVRGLPANQRHLHPNSNAWAANGPLVTGGRAILAGDPHLPLSLPSYWLQVRLRSPGYDVAGASVPGMPAVVIGRNRAISWSVTNAQSQATMYYVERTDPARPGRYYWRGAWRDMRRVEYTIGVRGGDPVPLTVDLTVHGPLMTLNDQRVAVSWMGNYPSPGLAALLALNRAGDFTEFRDALRNWWAPALNFVYADDRGSIGVIGAGHVPQAPPGAEPWLPMPGTGEADLVGVIPFAALPQVYNPAGHVVASTNQRPVGPDYPYYLGTSLDFDPGYRQSIVLAGIAGTAPATAADFRNLQANVTDDLAARMVPALLAAVADTAATGAERSAVRSLRGWDYAMREDSGAATVWWTFLRTYLSMVFGPWWEAMDVPVETDPWVFDLSTLPIPLREALEQWTTHDQDNPAFTPPGGPRRDAPAVMRAAFRAAVAKLGPHPAPWGRAHQREIPSITGAAGLGRGPFPASGDAWTVDSAVGGTTATFGPSWRMVVAWKGARQADAVAIYPAGQSENPSSPWYDNLISLWRRGEYVPLTGRAGGPVWTLTPARP